MDQPHPPVCQGTPLKSGLSEKPQVYGAPVVHDVNQPPSITFIGYLPPPVSPSTPSFLFQGTHLPNKAPASKPSSQALLCEGTKKKSPFLKRIGYFKISRLGNEVTKELTSGPLDRS